MSNFCSEKWDRGSKEVGSLTVRFKFLQKNFRPPLRDRRPPRKISGYAPEISFSKLLIRAFEALFRFHRSSYEARFVYWVQF